MKKLVMLLIGLIVVLTLCSCQILDMIPGLECDHDFGNWTQHADDAAASCDARRYYRTCSKCEETEWMQGAYEDHVFTTVTVVPTCTEQGYDEAVCSICGFSEKSNYTDQKHSYKNDYSYDESFHWKDCEICDATTAKEEHSGGDSGFCKACDQPFAPTAGVVYELSEDGKYAEVIAFNGTSRKVMIADAYKDVPVTKIREEAFKGSWNITRVIIPDSITEIGDYAFYKCDSLEDVIVGKGVTVIGEYAFADCPCLTSIAIPDGVVGVGVGAFEDCNSAMYTEYGYGRYVSSGENSYDILIEITDKSLDAYNIHEKTRIIADGAFSGCKSLESIVIPDGVRAVCNIAFKECSALASVTVPNSIVSIANGAFVWCYGLTDVYITDVAAWCGIKFTTPYSNPLYYADDFYIDGKLVTDLVIPDGVTAIGEYAFSNFSALTSVTVPDSVTEIGEYAFYFCGNLESVNIPIGVTSIPELAFAGCSALTSVVIPDGVSLIGNSAFSGCTGLTSVTIGSGVTSIGDRAFSGCTGLTSVTIPDSVTWIDDYAFRGCDSLASVTIGSGVTSIGEQAFDIVVGVKTINYRGSEAQWNKIRNSSYYTFSRVTIIYNYTGE